MALGFIGGDGASRRRNDLGWSRRSALAAKRRQRSDAGGGRINEKEVYRRERGLPPCQNRKRRREERRRCRALPPSLGRMRSEGGTGRSDGGNDGRGRFGSVRDKAAGHGVGGARADGGGGWAVGHHGARARGNGRCNFERRWQDLRREEERTEREGEEEESESSLSLSRLLAHVRGTWRGGGRAEEKWAKGREFGPRELEGGDLDFCRDLIWGWFEIRDSNRISDLEIEIWIGREIEIRDWHRL